MPWLRRVLLLVSAALATIALGVVSSRASDATLDGKVKLTRIRDLGSSGLASASAVSGGGVAAPDGRVVGDEAAPSAGGVPHPLSVAVTFGGTKYIVGPTVSPTSTTPEAEEYVALDPAIPSNLVATISDFSLRGGANTTKYASSTDGGLSWKESFVPLVNGAPATGDGQVWPFNSDPVVAIDLQGNVFLSELYFHEEFDNNANGVYVSVAPFVSGVGVTFTQSGTHAVAADLDPATTVIEDKPWLAVDNSHAATSGNVYVSWAHFVDNTDFILFSRSVDHGVTWSTPIPINPASQNGSVQGSEMAVGPSGEVYLVYEVFLTGGFRQQFLAKSVDGGQGFTTPIAITPRFHELSFSSTYRKNSFAALAVSPVDASVHLLYADQPYRISAIEYISSTNGGASFSSPRALEDASRGQRFMPALAVDELGNLNASWFDSRNVPLTSTTSYDIYAARSTNGGAIWTHNSRVTPSLQSAGSSSFIGDYSGIAAGGGFVHPVWTTGQGGHLATARLH
jgi:hypothetical protein